MPIKRKLNKRLFSCKHIPVVGFFGGRSLLFKETMIKIRQANQKDIDFILELTRENMEELVSWNDNLFLKNLKIDRILIALIGKKPVGLIDCEKKDCDLYIHNIQAKKEFQRRGVGRFLMDKAFSLARKLDCKKITLKVLKKNSEAVNFYKKIGFSFSSKADDKNIYLVKEFGLGRVVNKKTISF